MKITKKAIILGIITGMILATGIPSFFFTKYTFASNNYISNIKFFKDTDDLAKVSFYVNQSFDITIGPKSYCNDDGVCACEISNSVIGNVNHWLNSGNDYSGNIAIPDDAEYHFTCDRTYHFIAGQTYKGIIIAGNAYTHVLDSTNELCVKNKCGTGHANTDLIEYGGTDATLDSETYITNLGKAYDSNSNWPMTDTEKYYYKEYPTLTITNPPDNAEIAGDFNITGTITQPAPYEYNQVVASLSYENDWENTGEGYYIGEYTTDLTATSTQEFTLPIYGLPISDPGKIIVVMSLRNTTTNTDYHCQPDSAYPNMFKITTKAEAGAWKPPEEYPEWNKYLDIYSPSPSDDGYYKLKTPTSSIKFIYNFPEEYKIRITEDGNEKLATSTFKTLDPYNSKKFTIDNFNVSTSTPDQVEAKVYNTEDGLVISMIFPILGLKEGETQNIGLWNNIESFIKRILGNIIVPSPATLDKFKVNLPAELKSKIPISYFYDLKTAIANISVEEATSTPPLQWTIGEYAFSMNPVDFGATGLAETQGWRDIYDLTKKALWLIFALYVFGRIRDRTTNTAD